MVHKEVSSSGPQVWDQLETFLFKLNLDTENRLTVLRELQLYLFAEGSPLKACSLKKLLLGDGSLPGLIQLFCMGSDRSPLIDVECRHS